MRTNSKKVPVQGKCEGCSTTFDYEVFADEHGNPSKWGIRSYCDPCSEQAQREYEEMERKERQKKREAEFKEVVPPLYLDTDISRLGGVLGDLATNWEFNPTGLGLVGTSGSGKTRTAVLILQRMHADWKSCAYVTATQFAGACAKQFSEDYKEKAQANEVINGATKSQVLLFDDLGKNRMTDRAESALYELLEHRTSHLLPTIWTANAGSEELHKMFSADRADALLRRLWEFSKIVKV